MNFIHFLLNFTSNKDISGITVYIAYLIFNYIKFLNSNGQPT
jgi:hypothetical protein